MFLASVPIELTQWLIVCGKIGFNPIEYNKRIISISLEGEKPIGSMDWNFYALDIQSGWVVWKNRTAGPIVSTAAIFEDMVIFGTSAGHVQALDKNDGRTGWRFDAHGQVTGPVTVFEDMVYVGCVEGLVWEG